ncbi:MAG TPA: cytochrome c oxidase assembly factor Coa1 family protein [Blastocatellia bacterium]
MIGAIILVLIVAGAAALFLGIRHMLKSSGANEAAVAALRKSHVAAETLGEISDIGSPMGEISSDAGGTGHATLSMSVIGTRASGRYYATIEKVNGLWVVTSARIEFSDGESADLHLPDWRSTAHPTPVEPAPSPAY